MPLSEIDKNINFMITPMELNKRVKENSNVVIIDVRDKDAYDEGHIVDAVNSPEVFTYLPEGITTEEEKEDFVCFFEGLFGKAGVQKGDLVVFYEDKFTLMSPRGMMILKYLGFDENNIRVLDGGYISWCENDLQISTIATVNEPTEFTANIDENLFVDYDEMLKVINDESIITLDVRDKDEWLGISSSPYGIDFAPDKGRLPNAVWIEWYDFITTDMMHVNNLVKVQQELDRKNIRTDDDIVLYCFKGARLSNSYIALRRLGYKNIRIYFAGWNEWCRKDDAPKINEAQSSSDPILQENIALKVKLDRAVLENLKLTDFPYYNKEPIFSFNRDGAIVFQNRSKRENLANIVRFHDIFPESAQKDIHNFIDNNMEKSTKISVKNRYYLLNLRGSRDQNKILAYGFNITEQESANARLKESSQMLSRINKELERSEHEARILNETLEARVTAEVEKSHQKDLLLTQAQKLESVGQMAAGIAHEINTPTQFVNDNTRFLQEAFTDYGRLLAAYGKLTETAASGPVPEALLNEVKALAEEIDVDYLKEEIPQAIDQSLEGLERIARIVQAMKEFSHPGAEEKTPTDINRAIETTIDVSRNEWKYSAELITELDPGLPRAPMLPGEFNQAILNLIVNAAHAIEDATGEEKGLGEIRIATRQEGEWALISVSDTGKGIPEEIQKRIFDPFFTTKEVGKGSGQGLAIVWSVIVDKHQGTIDVASKEGKGATFTIRLPLMQGSDA